jgi:hypothetical protein
MPRTRPTLRCRRTPRGESREAPGAMAAPRGFGRRSWKALAGDGAAVLVEGLLLQVGWIAYWCPPSVMFSVSIQAHLSAFSLPEASFQPSWTEKKLSGSVTASEYSWPTTML